MDISIVGSPRRSRTQSADHSPEAVPDTEGNVLGPFFPSGSFLRVFVPHIALYARKRFLFDFIVRGFLYYGNNTLEFLRGTQGRCLRLYRYRPGGGVLVGVHVGRVAEKSLPTLYTAPGGAPPPSGAHAAGTRCGRTLRAHAT